MSSARRCELSVREFFEPVLDGIGGITVDLSINHRCQDFVIGPQQFSECADDACHSDELALHGVYVRPLFKGLCLLLSDEFQVLLKVVGKGVVY